MVLKLILNYTGSIGHEQKLIVLDWLMLYGWGAAEIDLEVLTFLITSLENQLAQELVQRIFSHWAPGSPTVPLTRAISSPKFAMLLSRTLTNPDRSIRRHMVIVMKLLCDFLCNRVINPGAYHVRRRVLWNLSTCYPQNTIETLRGLLVIDDTLTKEVNEALAGFTSLADREGQCNKLSSAVVPVCDQLERIGLYSTADRILVLGDGDFSFSLALSRALGGCNIWATCFPDKFRMLRVFSELGETLLALKALGTSILFKVDATKITQSFSDSCNEIHKFDVVVFNLPQAETNSHDREKNANLVRGFFRKRKECPCRRRAHSLKFALYAI